MKEILYLTKEVKSETEMIILKLHTVETVLILQEHISHRDQIPLG